MARYRGAHFLCRLFVMWDWNGKGRMDGGAEGVAKERQRLESDEQLAYPIKDAF